LTIEKSGGIPFHRRYVCIHPFKKDSDQLSRFLASRTAPAKEGKLCPILSTLKGPEKGICC